MNDNEQNELGEGLVYRALLPFEWHPVDENLDKGGLAAQLEGLIDTNERRLRAIAILNEYPTEMSDEFHQIEFKMNLLLELMGEVLATQMQLPPKSLVHLSANSLAWQDDCSVMPMAGQSVVLDVYLNQQYPKSISLSGKVVELESKQDGQCHCKVNFDAFPESMQDQLEKLIFTHHRREVAHNRRHQG